MTLEFIVCYVWLSGQINCFENQVTSLNSEAECEVHYNLRKKEAQQYVLIDTEIDSFTMSNRRCYGQA